MAKKRKNNPKLGGGKSSGGYEKLSDEQPKQPTRTSARKKAQKKKHRGSDAAADDYKLRSMVEADGLTIVDMNADGNCLFRALSDQLYGDLGNDHDDVRAEICDYMEQNPDDFKVFLVFDDDGEEGEDGKDFESYMANMRQDGEWGGNLELVAAARLYRRNITVFSATLAAITINHDSSQSSGPDLLLSFHDNDHYNSVRDQKSPPKRKSLKRNNSKPKKGANGKTSVTNHAELDKSPGSGNAAPESETETTTTAATATTTTTSMASSSCGKKTSVSNSMSELSVNDGSEKSSKQSSIKPPKKNSSCPCGSGQRYKKCCAAREKHAKRVESMKNKDSDEGNEEEESGAHEEVAMKGNFRVLQI